MTYRVNAKVVGEDSDHTFPRETLDMVETIAQSIMEKLEAYNNGSAVEILAAIIGNHLYLRAGGSEDMATAMGDEFVKLMAFNIMNSFAEELPTFDMWNPKRVN
jgi:hypothetical protein